MGESKKIGPSFQTNPQIGYSMRAAREVEQTATFTEGITAMVNKQNNKVNIPVQLNNTERTGSDQAFCCQEPQ